jgi:hypothetical protein
LLGSHAKIPVLQIVKAIAASSEIGLLNNITKSNSFLTLDEGEAFTQF